MARDLEGVLVVTLEQAVAAPFASSRLVDAGARVIKLERSEGDFARRYDSYVNGQSAYFVWLNAGKESVCIDIKDPADIAFLHRLLAKADVFIQNLAPGATERAGIGSKQLLDLYPGLIVCNISGYGPDGPYRTRKAYDLLVQAESGLAALSGAKDEPGRVGVSICDIACGMYAYQSILQALFARNRTGEGRIIEVSLFHSMADWMNVPYLQYRYGGHYPVREGLSHPTIAPYGVYSSGDGHQLLISVQNEREWVNLCAKVIGNVSLAIDPRFSTNTARVGNRRELDSIMTAAFGKLTRDQLSERLLEASIAFGNISTLADLLEHPQLRLQTVETSTGPVELLGRPGRAREDTDTLGSVPEIGQHDKAVRAEFQSPSPANRQHAKSS